MADTAVSLAAVLLIGAVFVVALGVLVWALPIRALADWLDRWERDIDSIALVLLALLVTLVLAGQVAVHI